MTIGTPANLHTGIDSGGSVTNFTSPTLSVVTAGMAADGCVLLHFFGQDTSAPYPSGISSPAGLGLTWRVARFEIQASGATRWFDALLVGTKQPGDTGPTNGTFTCTITSSSSTRLGFEAALILSGVDVTTMSSWPVSGTNSTAATGLTPTVGSADPSGIIFTTAGHRTNEAQNLEAGWTELAEFQNAAPSYCMSMGYRAGNGDLSAAWTWTTSQTAAACIIAISPSAAAPIPSRWSVVRLSLMLDQRPFRVKGMNVYAVQPYVGATGTDESGLYTWFANATNRANFARHLKYYGFNAIRLPVMNDNTTGYYDKVGAIGASLWAEGVATLVCPFDGQAQSVGGFGDNFPDDTVGGTNSAAVACGDWLSAAWLYLGSPDWFLFDTYNEPNQGGSLTDAAWLSGMQVLLTHARASGYSGPIFVEGTGWSHDFPTNVATLLAGDSQIVMECHRYATNDGASQPSLDGSDATVTWKAAWPDTATPLGVAICIGEFGPFNNGYGNNALAFVQTIGTLTDNVDRTSYTLVTTNNVTAGNVAVLVIEGHHSSLVVQPSISGHGLTWTPAGRQGSTVALDVFYGTGTPDGTDIVINFGSTHIGCIANCFEVSGADTSIVIEQIAFATGSGTTGPVSLPRPPKFGLVVSAVGHLANEVANSGTGWTAISDSSFTTPNAGLQTERQAANDQSYDPSWTTSSVWISMIAEIRLAGSGGSFENNVNNWCRSMAGAIEQATRRGQCVGSFAWTLLWDDDLSAPANSLWLNNATEMAAFNAGTNIGLRNLWGELVYGMFIEARTRWYDIYRARQTAAIVSAVGALAGVSGMAGAPFNVLPSLAAIVGVSAADLAAFVNRPATASLAGVSAQADLALVVVGVSGAAVGVSAADLAGFVTVPSLVSVVGVSAADLAGVVTRPTVAALVGVSAADLAAFVTRPAPAALVAVSDAVEAVTVQVPTGSAAVGVSAADAVTAVSVVARSAPVGVSAAAEIASPITTAAIAAFEGVSAEAVQAALSTAAIGTLVGVSLADGAAVVIRPAAAALLGVSAQADAGVVVFAAPASLVGVSLLDGQGAAAQPAFASLVGVSAQADAGLRLVVAPVSMVGVGSAAEVVSVAGQALASVVGVSAEAAQALVVVSGTGALVGVSLADAIAARTIAANASLVGVSAADLAATVVVVATVAVVGVSDEAAGALVQVVSRATLVGVSAADTGASRIVVGAAAFVGESAADAAASLTTAAQAAVVGVGAAELSSAPQTAATASLVAVSAQQAAAVDLVVARAALVGVSAEDADARQVVATAVAFEGVSAAKAAAGVVVQATAALSGVSAADAATSVRVVAQAVMAAVADAGVVASAVSQLSVSFVDSSALTVRATVGLFDREAPCAVGALFPSTDGTGALFPSTAGSGGLVPATDSSGDLEECDA